MSTREQAEEDKTSLGSQLSSCRELAESNGWAVVEEITDDVTGYTLDRDGPHRVRAMARERALDVLVCWKMTRFSRSDKHIEELYPEFQRAGVRIVFVREGEFEDTAMGRYLRRTYAMVGELDREARKEARTGYVVDERSAGVVRWLFERTLAGDSTRTLARTLTERGELLSHIRRSSPYVRVGTVPASRPTVCARRSAHHSTRVRVRTGCCVRTMPVWLRLSADGIAFLIEHRLDLVKADLGRNEVDVNLLGFFGGLNRLDAVQFAEGTLDARDAVTARNVWCDKRLTLRWH